MKSSSLPKVLIVIDMQTGFNAAGNKETQRAVRRLIEEAVQNKCLVLIVEFGLDEVDSVHGKTYKFLLEPLSDVDCPQGWSIVRKAWVDGSQEICDSLKQYGISNVTFVVCGICTHGCVQETVTGLSAKLPDSTFLVCKEACWNDLTGNDWARFSTPDNVSLVSSDQCFAA